MCKKMANCFLQDSACIWKRLIMTRLTYSRFAPQFGNRGGSRSDLKDSTVQACKSEVVRNEHEDARAIGSRITRSYLKRLHHVTTPTEQICHISTLAINVQLCHH